MPFFQTLGRSVGDLLGQPAPVPAPVMPTYGVRGTQLTDADLSQLRNVLFAEISNRDPQHQQLEARTIINTALNRIPQYAQKGKSMTLSDVLTAPNQYQGYNSPEYKRFVAGSTTPADGQKVAAINGVIGQLKSGSFPDTTNGRVFYHHDPQGRIWLQDGGLYQPARTVADLTQTP